MSDKKINKLSSKCNMHIDDFPALVQGGQQASFCFSQLLFSVFLQSVEIARNKCMVLRFAKPLLKED
jgi:hypothetical protein